MSDGFDVKVKTNLFGKVIKAFSNVPHVEVKVIGPAAEYAKYHEFGTANIPKRSFLRVPLDLFLNSSLEADDRFDENLLKKTVRDGNMNAWGEIVAEDALEVIQDGFSTGGYGQWAPLAPSTLKAKGTDEILVDTELLRNSIVAEVVD